MHIVTKLTRSWYVRCDMNNAVYHIARKNDSWLLKNCETENKKWIYLRWKLIVHGLSLNWQNFLTTTHKLCLSLDISTLKKNRWQRGRLRSIASHVPKRDLHQHAASHNLHPRRQPWLPPLIGCPTLNPDPHLGSLHMQMHEHDRTRQAPRRKTLKDGLLNSKQEVGPNLMRTSRVGSNLRMIADRGTFI